MDSVLHIVDATTRPDVLDQLALLAGEGDRAVSVGPAPRHELPVPVVAVHRPMGSALLTGWRMPSRAAGADVLHAWSPAAMQAGRELALTTGAAMVLSLPCAGEPKQVRAVRQALGAGLFTVTVPTRSDREALVDAGLPARAVHVLPPAAPPPAADRSAVRKRVRDDLAIDESELLIAVPDPMIRSAGHDFASWAHAIVRQARGGLCLIFPGGGHLAEHVRWFAGTTGYDEEIFFTGERFAPAEVLAAADLAVFFHERDVGVLGLTAAMAWGLPIAASRTPEIAELTGDGAAALLTEPGDPREASAALLKLADEPQLAADLGAAARRIAAERSAPADVRRRLREIHAAAIEVKAF